MKQACCHPHASRGFGSIIEILIVAFLIVGGLAMYMSFSSGSKDVQRALDEADPNAVVERADPNAPHTIYGRAIRKAVSFECKENLRQVRMLVMNAKNESENGNPPASLSEIPETARIRFCPVGKTEYAYDSVSGEVHCTYPSHENY